MTPATIGDITSKIKENWSPEQITGRLKSELEDVIKVNQETIYKFIWGDKKQRCYLYTYLRLHRKAKKYTSRSKGHKLAVRLLKIKLVLNSAQKKPITGLESVIERFI